jgi:hypothetical protein
MISWRSVATSLAVALALVVAALTTSGCGPASAEQRALEHASEHLGVPVASLRVTERSDLSTSRHAVLRISDHNRSKELTVAVARKGGLVVDALEGNAFSRLAAAEHLGSHFDQLGGARVAGWFGALAGGKPCGEPVVASVKEVVQVEALPDGGHRISYRFTDGDKLMRCRLTISPQGAVREAFSEAAPVAKREPAPTAVR